MSPAAQLAIKKYLEQYSHAVDLGNWPENRRWQQVMIIPVCGESPQFLTQLMQHNHNQSVLTILLLNRPAGQPKTQAWQQQNQQLLEAWYKTATDREQLTDQHAFFYDPHGTAVLLLNFNDQPFDHRKGVGLARKIAADTALQLIHNGVIQQPWIYSTDADVILPAGYFAITDGQAGAVALSLNFAHVSDDQGLLQLQEWYDFKLRYYQQGMRHMGVAYDYIPLGSTLVVAAKAYAQVRGFPAKSGGEDFYLLNKLAKIGQVRQLSEPVVNIRIRLSDRVPFGTGPAISQIQDLHNNQQQAEYYHPQIFHLLKTWRQQLLAFYDIQQMPANDHGLNAFWQLPVLLEKNRQQINSHQRWLQFIHEWFDAFKILKSVHFLRSSYPSVSKQELLEMPAYQALSAGRLTTY